MVLSTHQVSMYKEVDMVIKSTMEVTFSSLGDDASKQGRIDIGDINTDAEITLIDETQGRINDIIADEDITLIPKLIIKLLKISQQTRELSQWKQEKAILRVRNNLGRRPGKERMLPEKERGEGKIRGDSNTTVFHGTLVKSISISRIGGPQETTTNTRQKTSIEGKGVQLAKGRDNQKVQHPEWITNPTLIKLESGPWQVRMVEDDEEKTRFHTKEGVHYFTHMLKGLKNSAATLQRMVEKVLASQKGQNVEVYLEEIVVKSKDKQSLTEDMEETLNKLKWVNMKIDPNESIFGIKEGSKEGSGVGIILLGPDEKMYSYAIRLNFDAPDHSMDYEALLAGLVASAGKHMKDLYVFVDSQILVDQVEGSRTPTTEETKKYKEEIMDATTPFHKFRITRLPKNLNFKTEVLTGLATIKLEFLNQEVSVGIKTRPSVKVGSNDKERKATSKAPMRKPNYNWETSGSN
ncbi:reverse transcriptase domain-containing protein [Tanacetum coccineum]